MQIVSQKHRIPGQLQDSTFILNTKENTEYAVLSGFEPEKPKSKFGMIPFHHRTI
jgi:hypothetical protein